MLKHAILLATLVFTPTTAAAQARDQATEIVVTARRTGAPVWRVSSGSATLVVVGTITEVAQGTPWRPEALAVTVQRADRVMFPETMQVAVSPLAMFGYLAKWKRQARLPKGQSLRSLASPGYYARLSALARAKKAPGNFDRLHPLHLAIELRSDLRRETRMMRDASEIVSRASLKHKVRRVPIRTVKARPVAEILFRSRPAQHLPCLHASIRLTEEGPAGLRARSHAWANKRIPAVLASTAEEVERQCFPSGFVDGPGLGDLVATSRRLLAGSGTTLAVLSLDSAARGGGLLDQLSAAGYRIDGPAWR